MDGLGTVRNAKEKAREIGIMQELRLFLNKAKVRIVLTAHPTQFYPVTMYLE
ncbi:MAG: hypothetical protein R2771_16480 [Saprospiraceae bacterium]